MMGDLDPNSVCNGDASYGCKWGGSNGYPSRPTPPHPAWGRLLGNCGHVSCIEREEDETNEENKHLPST
ncbi:hypothetical protein TIFTF001_009810 [Ficus carica]|uniref:Uncharacterized protein n=1 Tax=Ficus carica TaxID=3494 RepID=A0AA88D3X6_FICCA|nr:hypothetical protein TIFTF001_009810 [Ficus carica]